MEEFTAEMRRLTNKKLPSMSENIFKPLPEENQGEEDDAITGKEDERRRGLASTSTSSSNTVIGIDEPLAPAVGVVGSTPGGLEQQEDQEEETIISGWWKEVVQGAEEERKRARVIRVGSRG